MLTSVSQRFQTQIRTKTKKSYTSLSSIINHIDSPGIESCKTLLKKPSWTKTYWKTFRQRDKTNKSNANAKNEKKREITRKQSKVLRKKIDYGRQK